MDKAKLNKIILTGLPVIIATTVSGCSLFGGNSNSPTPTPNTTGYKDGNYTATGNYISPGGPESIEVSVTLQDGNIADINVVSKAERPQSKQMQAAFISGYKTQVIGKPIDQVELVGAISGSSLTPQGFNDAIEKIKDQAQVG